MEKVLKTGGILMEKVLKIGSVLTEKVLKSKEYDTKDYTLLLVWGKSFTRTCAEVHSIVEEISVRLRNMAMGGKCGRER